jgi:aspartyl/glutamyl-tRNA(Asn/Gln) amidotransferase C subunit
MSEISAETVRHLAHLAHIALSEDEIEALTVDLTQIVDSFAAVGVVATDDVPPTSHPIPLENVYRDDSVGEVLSRNAILANAPEHDGGRFAVAAILDEEQ